MGLICHRRLPEEPTQRPVCTCCVGCVFGPLVCWSCHVQHPFIFTFVVLIRSFSFPTAPSHFNSFPLFRPPTCVHPHDPYCPGMVKPPAMVVEYMGARSLRGCLNRGSDMLASPLSRVMVALDVAKGMEYLHNKSVVHLDLKSGNVRVHKKYPFEKDRLDDSCSAFVLCAAAGAGACGTEILQRTGVVQHHVCVCWVCVWMPTRMSFAV